MNIVERQFSGELKCVVSKQEINGSLIAFPHLWVNDFLAEFRAWTGEFELVTIASFSIHELLRCDPGSESSTVKAFEFFPAPDSSRLVIYENRRGYDLADSSLFTVPAHGECQHFIIIDIEWK